MKQPIPERGLMLGRGLANVGTTLGADGALDAVVDAATATASPSSASTSGDRPTAGDEPGAASATTTPTPGSAAGTAPTGAGGSPLLIAVAVLAGLGAAVLGWLGWRSR